MSAVTPDQEKCLLIARWRRLLSRFCDADTVERASPGTKAAGKALAARYRLVAAAAMEAAREPIEAAIFMVRYGDGQDLPDAYRTAMFDGRTVKVRAPAPKATLSHPDDESPEELAALIFAAARIVPPEMPQMVSAYRM